MYYIYKCMAEILNYSFEMAKRIWLVRSVIMPTDRDTRSTTTV